MIRIAVIGLAAAAALTFAAPTASAGVTVNLGIGTGFGVVGPYDPYPYGSPYVGPVWNDPDCHYVTKWNWVVKPNGKKKKVYYKKLVCY
jgi:hypothetical protein